jgi:hypothetical protein
MSLEFQQTQTGSQLQCHMGTAVDDNKNGVYWAISPHARATIGVDGGVLLDIEKGLCYSLNLVGAKIWLAIESGKGQTTFQHIVNTLGMQFTVPGEQLVRDIDEYLRDLEKKGLIKAAGRT